MGQNPIDSTQITREARKTLKDHWQLFVIQGVILIILGALSIAAPVFASLAASVVIGWILVIAGIARAVTLLRSHQMQGHWASLLLSVLMVVLGAVLLLYPVEGAATLTIGLIAYFIAHGAASLYFAFSVKSDSARWFLLVLSGVVDLVLAVLVIAGLPGASVWAPGLYLGINLFLTGFAFIVAALSARSAPVV